MGVPLVLPPAEEDVEEKEMCRRRGGGGRTRGSPGPLSLSTLRRRWISTIAYMSVLVMAAAVVVDIHDGSLTVESCLKDYPATVCCADELPAHVGVTRCLGK